jgi:hypothetical protein
MAPDFIFLKDTNGDGKADLRETIISGWGKSDTHAGPSNLRYGFDNKVWGVLGYSGFQGQIDGKDFSFSQGVFTVSIRMAPILNSLAIPATIPGDLVSLKNSMSSYPQPMDNTAPTWPCPTNM